MVEIAKVMNVTKQSGSEHCLILLDEPTSVLNEAEVENLYKQMRKIAAQGHAVIFVSHHLNEILEVTDRIYVYKDGTSVGSLDTRDADEAKLYEMMVASPPPRSTTIWTARPHPRMMYFWRPKTWPARNLQACQLPASPGRGAGPVRRGGLRRGRGVRGALRRREASFGEISVRGRAVRFRSPKQRLREGDPYDPKGAPV